MWVIYSLTSCVSDNLFLPSDLSISLAAIRILGSKFLYINIQVCLYCYLVFSVPHVKSDDSMILLFLKYFYFLLFSPLPLSPYPLPPPFSPFRQQSPHCCSCPWFFSLSLSFLLKPPPPSLTLLSSPELFDCSLSLSLFCLLVQFVPLI